MHKMMLFVAVAALAGCSQEKAAAPAEDANAAAEANAAAPAATPAAMSLNETTWTFTMDGKPIEESIDASGNYIATTGTEHFDHGTVAMVDGKACFTSAMDKEGPECWTVKDTAVGGSEETTSDKGGKLTVTRVAYVAKTMPATN